MDDTIEFTVDNDSTQNENSTENPVEENEEFSNEQKEVEQEQEQEVTETDDDSNKDDDSSIDAEGGQFDATEIYRFLQDNGIAPSVENYDDIKDIDDVSKLIYNKQEELIEEKLQEQLNSTTNSYKDLFNHLRNGGKLDDFVNTYNDSYDDIQSSSLKDDDELQNKVIRDFYKNTTQWDNELIEANIAKLNDDEKTEFSKKALDNLKTIQAQKKQQLAQQEAQRQQQAQQQQQQQIDAYKKNITELKQVGELPVSVQDKQNIEKLLFNDVTYNKLATNFEDYRMNLVILDHLGLLDDPNQISQYAGKTKKKTYNFKKGEGKKDVATNKHFNFELVEPETSNTEPLKIDW